METDPTLERLRLMQLIEKKEAVPNAASSEERSGAHATGSERRSCALRQSCRGAKAILEKRRSEQSTVEGKD